MKFNPFSTIYFIDSFIQLCISIQKRSQDKIFILEVKDSHLQYGDHGLRLISMRDEDIFSKRLGFGISKQSTYSLCSTLINKLKQWSIDEDLNPDVWYAFEKIDGIKDRYLQKELSEAFLHALYDIDINAYNFVRLKIRKPR